MANSKRHKLVCCLMAMALLLSFFYVVPDPAGRAERGDAAACAADGQAALTGEMRHEGSWQNMMSAQTSYSARNLRASSLPSEQPARLPRRLQHHLAPPCPPDPVPHKKKTAGEPSPSDSIPTYVFCCSPFLPPSFPYLLIIVTYILFISNLYL